MAIKHLIDFAYQIAKDEYKSKEFTFNQIYNTIISKPIANYPQQSIGEIYQEMLQDARFIYVGKDEWKLREFLTEEQISNIDRNLYNIVVDDSNKTDEKVVDDKIEKELDEAEVENEEEPTKDSSPSDVEE